MHVAEFGPADATPIVFLHGSMVAGWMWMGQVEDLCEDHRCVVPDLPGFDHSGDERWLSFAATGGDVAAMIGRHCTDGSAHVVGLSLGGIVGFWLARHHPDRVRSLLVSGVPFGPISGPARWLGRVLLWLYRRRWGAGLVARVFGIPDRESRDAFIATAGRTDPRALETITEEVNEAPLPDDLHRITAPVLAVVGEKDTEPARRAVRYLTRVLPLAEGRVVPRVGHQWNAEDRALFSAMVRSWIDEGLIDSRLESLDRGTS